MIRDVEIDLTEYRDFGGRAFALMFSNSDVEEINKAFRRQYYGFFPWSVVPLYKHFEYDGLIALGNKQQRKESIEIKSWGTLGNIVCDCCGREYKKIPWKENSGLCQECIVKNGYNEPILPWN